MVMGSNDTDGVKSSFTVFKFPRSLRYRERNIRVKGGVTLTPEFSPNSIIRFA